MTATTAAGARRFRIGRVLGDSFRVLGANLLPFLTLTLLLIAPVYVALGLGGDSTALVAPDSGLDFLALIVEMMLSFVAEAALVYGTFRQLQGRRGSFGDTVATGLRNVLPVVLVSLAVGLLALLGLAVLVIPGLIVMTVYAAAVPAAVVEHLGVGASLNRSATLTKGCRWRVFGVLLVTIFLQIGLEMVIELALDFQGNPIASLVVAWLLSGAISALYAVLATVIYHELRHVKEGSELDEIAAVFD